MSRNLLSIPSHSPLWEASRNARTAMLRCMRWLQSAQANGSRLCRSSVVVLSGGLLLRKGEWFHCYLVANSLRYSARQPEHRSSNCYRQINSPFRRYKYEVELGEVERVNSQMSKCSLLTSTRLLAYSFNYSPC